MKNLIYLFKYRVAVGIVNKQLRESIIINNKSMTMVYLNNDFQIKYGKSWNSGREETLPNTTLENIILLADYFGLSVEKYFEKVNQITPEQIDIAILSKQKLTALYNQIVKK